MEIQFTDKNTATLIDNTTIRHQSEDGIVIQKRDSWKFIPASNLEQHTIQDSLFAPEPIPLFDDKTDHNPFLTNSTEAGIHYTEKAEYRFGFSHLRFLNRQTAASSGLISDWIDVSNQDYITVSCVADTTGGAVEIYVVDGTEEIPILPENTWDVSKEKLFYNQNTRFIVDETQTKPILYEDNKITAKDYTLITPIEFHEHLYTLSYTAAGTPNRYTVHNPQIRIKLIIRQYQNLPMVRIKSITVNRYGESLQWNLNP